MNLVSTMMQFLTPMLINKIASSLGMNNAMVTTAIGALLPTILAGLAGKAGTPSGATALSSTLNQQDQNTLGSFGFTPQVLVTVFEPGKSVTIDPDPLLLATMFDLTPAEAKVAVALAKGLSPKKIAVTLCLAVSTVRSQLKTIFSKTGARRQSELVGMLLAVGEF